MLVGRDHEQLALVRLLENARVGGSGVLALVGEAGIGKSALLAYAQEQATGMNVLRARGVQSEAHIPFAGLFELLRPALTCIDQIPGPQAAALESALALRPASAPGRFAVGAATLSLLAAYSEAAPVAVLVDDAHWLDGSSADALLLAFRRLFLNPKTIEYHLRNVYRKLSIGSRSELKAAMTGLGSNRLRDRPDARRRCGTHAAAQLPGYLLCGADSAGRQSCPPAGTGPMGRPRAGLRQPGLYPADRTHRTGRSGSGS
jgi:hypothetical protein